MSSWSCLVLDHWAHVSHTGTNAEREDGGYPHGVRDAYLRASACAHGGAGVVPSPFPMDVPYQRGRRNRVAHCPIICETGTVPCRPIGVAHGQT
jgi:hypothetical protein